MTRIGIRELRQRASQLLRRVQAGETIEVTDRGRPIALITPLPEASPYDALVESGDITPAPGDAELPEPLEPLPGEELPSEILARLRSDEP
jgi:prevent-host-death family protein